MNFRGFNQENPFEINEMMWEGIQKYIFFYPHFTVRLSIGIYENPPYSMFKTYDSV